MIRAIRCIWILFGRQTTKNKEHVGRYSHITVDIAIALALLERKQRWIWGATQSLNPLEYSTLGMLVVINIRLIRWRAVRFVAGRDALGGKCKDY